MASAKNRSGTVDYLMRHIAVLGVAVLPTLVFAQSDDLSQSEYRVTLIPENGEGISGEFIELQGGLFIIDSPVGIVMVPQDDVSCIGVACPEGTKLERTGNEVKLSSLDGSVELRGDLLSVTEDQYVLASDFGEIRVDIGKVICEGESCPTLNVAPVFGGEVTIFNDSVRITGILREVKEDLYVIEHETFGLINVGQEGMTCEGDGCP